MSLRLYKRIFYSVLPSRVHLYSSQKYSPSIHPNQNTQGERLSRFLLQMNLGTYELTIRRWEKWHG